MSCNLVKVTNIKSQFDYLIFAFLVIIFISQNNTEIISGAVRYMKSTTLLVRYVKNKLDHNLNFGHTYREVQLKQLTIKHQKLRIEV